MIQVPQTIPVCLPRWLPWMYGKLITNTLEGMQRVMLGNVQINCITSTLMIGLAPSTDWIDQRVESNDNNAIFPCLAHKLFLEHKLYFIVFIARVHFKPIIIYQVYCSTNVTNKIMIVCDNSLSDVTELSPVT